MGQSVTRVKDQFSKLVSSEEGEGIFRREISVVQKEAAVFKDVALLTREKLKDAVLEINTLLKTYCFDSNIRVVFGVTSISDQGLLWKASVKILCFKVHSVNSSVRITRCMNLIQFWKLRQGILQQLETKALAEAAQIPTVEPRATYQGSDTADEAGESQKKDELTTSAVLAKVDAIVDDDSECCICMERKSEVSLACAHSYCRTCIDQWSDDHKSCPTCRQQIEASEEFWEMPDAPDMEEIRHYVVSLASGT